MTQRQPFDRQEAGFSLVELLTVVFIITVVAGMALYSLTGAMPNIQANNALNTCASVVKQGKYLALSQRRGYQLMFTGNNGMFLRRNEVNGGFTDLPVVNLPGSAQFIIYPGAGIGTTPDAYGNYAAAVDCTGSCSVTQTFLSNGNFIDATGRLLDMTIYVGLPGNPATQRAITISGGTGRIRAYRWSGGSWLEY